MRGAHRQGRIQRSMPRRYRLTWNGKDQIEIEPRKSSCACKLDAAVNIVGVVMAFEGFEFIDIKALAPKLRRLTPLEKSIWQ